MMSEPGTFAHTTLTKRWRDILQRTIAQTDFPPDIVANLEALLQELPNGEVRSLHDDRGPDLAAWASYIAPYRGRRWIDVPWYFGESYLYRRILEATYYFLPGFGQGVDPFISQKRTSLETTMNAIRFISNQLSQDSNQYQDNLTALLYGDLWGNQADLSLFATVTSPSNDRADPKLNQILVDDTTILADYIANLQAARIDFIVDNVGLELVSDLYLADFLLTTNTASTVHLHLKAHPTFVSDAMPQDVTSTIEVLAADRETSVQAIAQRLQSQISTGQLQLRSDFFWTAPLPFWEMPSSIRQDLAQASLIIVKGDANYRRLLGDCQWSYTTPFADIVCYFPTAVVALRTLKAELAAGLQPSQIETLNQEDQQWLTNGQWGLIQFLSPESLSQSDLSDFSY